MTPCPQGYYLTMRECKDPRYLRLRLVQFAQQHGLKPAARCWGCTPATVRLWTRRFDGSLDSLAEHSRAPHHSPNKLSLAAEARILAAKAALPSYSPRRLKLVAALPYSAKAIYRVLRERHLLRAWRRKKHVVKHCLRELKRHWRAWQQLSVDTKHLSDLPEYWLQAQYLR